MPKRKIEDVYAEGSDDCEIQPDCSESTDDSNGSTNSVNCGSGQSRKRMRRSVNFEQVEVFYFPRAQGFACVPSQGGTTLGMTEKHVLKEEYPLKHYRKLRKLVRRKKAEVEESAENSFSIDAINDISQDEIVQTDSEEDDTETDGFFLQPVPIRLRRSLLKLSGVKKVDSAEREECKELRGSREECGCSCATVCVPETCLCSINGIQCQVDRFSFPCGCSKKGCGNPSGRIEFNPNKVQRHYQHTMTRLENEKFETEDLVDASYEPRERKKAKHIRFLENDETVEGEKVTFNSTEDGCCLDCSLTSCVSHTISSDLPPAQFFANLSSSPSLSDELDSNFACVSDTASSAASSELALPSVSLNDQPNILNFTSKTLEPISGLLNPILNTADSLDMYCLQRHSEPVMELVLDNDFSENALSQWQSLSHESLLTTSSLIPMKDAGSECSEDGSSQSSYGHDNSSSGDSQSEQPLSFTSLKPSPVSFQLQSSRNVVHAMRSEFGDPEQSKQSATPATVLDDVTT